MALPAAVLDRAAADGLDGAGAAEAKRTSRGNSSGLARGDGREGGSGESSKHAGQIHVRLRPPPCSCTRFTDFPMIQTEVGNLCQERDLDERTRLVAVAIVDFSVDHALCYVTMSDKNKVYSGKQIPCSDIREKTKGVN